MDAVVHCVLLLIATDVSRWSQAAARHAEANRQPRSVSTVVVVCEDVSLGTSAVTLSSTTMYFSGS